MEKAWEEQPHMHYSGLEVFVRCWLQRVVRRCGITGLWIAFSFCSQITWSLYVVTFLLLPLLANGDSCCLTDGTFLGQSWSQLFTILALCWAEARWEGNVVKIEWLIGKPAIELGFLPLLHLPPIGFSLLPVWDGWSAGSSVLIICSWSLDCHRLGIKFLW